MLSVLKKLLTCREKAWWGAIVKIQEVVLMIGCTVMMLTIVAETIARYIFHYDLAGYEDVVLFTSMWVYMLGASYQTRREKLITADLTSLFLKKDSQIKVVKLISGTISLFASVFLLICGYEYFVWAFAQKATTPSLNIPLKFVQMSLFVGYVFIVFYNIFILIERGVAMFDKEQPEEGGREK